MTSSLNAALMRLAPRAETNDPDALVRTFVDAGPLFTLLSTRKHQVLYGRRGTGKTHALQYLGSQVREGGGIAVYVDLRKLGSTGGLYSDTNLPVQQRATGLLVDALLAISNAVYEEVLAMEAREPELLVPALTALEQLGEVASQVRVVGTATSEAQATAQTSMTNSAGLGVLVAAPPSVSVGARQDGSNAESLALKRTVAGREEHVVHFGSTTQALSRLIKELPEKRLWILLDEWSVIPLDLQPLLADFIRRCLLPVSGLIVKIAAIEQRSNFRLFKQGGDYVGIELGADVSADLDFDDFMVFSNDAEQAKTFFAELLFRHVVQAAGETTATQKREIEGTIKASTDLISRGFTQSAAFEELVRSAEGVPRDAINIASFAAQRAMNDAISVPVVRTAARKWYQRDKESAVQANDEALQLLHWIHREVIGTRKARAFLVPQEVGSTNALLRALFDARVLHVIKKGVSGGDEPGRRFDTYALDYGCYVELVSTKAAVTSLFGDEEEMTGDVPADDYRAIRRAILDLDKFSVRLRPR